ncbi:metalloreductase [Verticillium alfalfae VaMs.102]|uniref:Metalloreductase n=1 Tax=Verticillium alfalfae (strain VaMs.102 / ATCC MYA-4576 / FGSC 10136) TaxID=526221 RepID=C9SGT6_VERA1|nr:metalloreductase [Verticillium alfalfae VaMs.102]EEY18180.1 metalloreductase [Verticillium alfalfae VaMs.102]
MAIFIGFHFTRILAYKSGLAPRFSIFASPFLFASRVLRRRLLAKAPFLPSVGHAGLALIYVGLNIVLTFKPLMNHPALALLSNIASRTGWLALANICLAVFLGLKNTPLGYLTTWSYERLNVIHQILFYLVHVSFFVVTMVFIGLHQPETHKHILIATGVGAGMWALDRLLRILRVSLYSFNNQATIHPLPHGGTRIVLRKPPIGASSGEHCFLWVPRIRSVEMHPFTIAAADPLEFVVASYDGFTRDLHKYAIQNPGASLRASVEGSYGTFPDPTSYDKVVLIAGGSGASFTVGMALNMIKHANAGSQQSVVFIWMVKDNDHQGTGQGLSVTMPLHPPQPCSATAQRHFRPRTAPLTPLSMTRKRLAEDRPGRVLTRHISDPEKSEHDLEPESPTSPCDTSAAGAPRPHQQSTSELHIHGIPITYARPDISALIHHAIAQTPSSQRVLVMGCGPEGLMTEVRNTTAKSVRRKGPAVELHCEQFGW